MKNFLIIFLFFFVSCSAIENSTDTSSNATQATAAQQLYSNYCFGCHAQNPEQNIPGATSAIIQNAINNNTGGMNRLADYLDSNDIIEIASYICELYPDDCIDNTEDGEDTENTEEEITTTEMLGAQVWQNECAECHGDIADETADVQFHGRSPTDIRASINIDRGGMGILSGLTDTDLQNVASYIAAYLDGEVNRDGEVE